MLICAETCRYFKGYVKIFCSMLGYVVVLCAGFVIIKVGYFGYLCYICMIEYVHFALGMLQ